MKFALTILLLIVTGIVYYLFSTASGMGHDGEKLMTPRHSEVLDLLDKAMK